MYRPTSPQLAYHLPTMGVLSIGCGSASIVFPDFGDRYAAAFITEGLFGITKQTTCMSGVLMRQCDDLFIACCDVDSICIEKVYMYWHGLFPLHPVTYPP